MVTRKAYFNLTFTLAVWVFIGSILIVAPFPWASEPEEAFTAQSGDGEAGVTAVNYSLRFYGHGVNDIDRVKIKIDAPPRPADVGAGDFTIEWWMKATPGDNPSTGAQCGSNDGWIYGNILIDRDINGPGDYGDYGISLSEEKIVFGTNNGSSGNTVCGNISVADGAWHHVAVTRRASDGQLCVFVDGQQDVCGSGPTGNLSYRDGRPIDDNDNDKKNDPYLVIGAEKHYSDPRYPAYSGWFDELRISSVRRYSGSFTPPSSPFVPDANTAALYHFDEGPAGPCTGTVLDSSGASGGPSHGECRYGGSAPSGPVYSADSPFPTVLPTLTPQVYAPAILKNAVP